MEYKTVTFDNNKFNNYVVYENGQICKVLKSGEHRPLKYTLGKKGGIKVTLCADKYRKSVSVNHITATEFLGELLCKFDTVEPIDGDYTNTHKNNLKVIRKHKQVPSKFPKKKEGALRYCRVCDYKAETEEQLEEFVKAKDGDGTEYGRRNLCKSCRKAQRRNDKYGCGLFSMLTERGRYVLVGEGNGSYYERNKEKVLAKVKEWAQNNRGKSNAYKAKNKKDRGLRTPKWLTEDDLWVIEQFYITAAERTEQYGIQFHVDHIIPLKGEKVSGLHVPENLQILPWYENIEKSNKYEMELK